MSERLQISQWGEFERLFKEHFSSPPPGPTEAIVVVEKKDGKIIGFAITRVYTVMETVWVDQTMRGKGVVTRLCIGVLTALPRLQTLFTFTTDPRLAKLYEHFGMEDLTKFGWRCLRWVRR